MTSFFYLVELDTLSTCCLFPRSDLRFCCYHDTWRQTRPISISPFLRGSWRTLQPIVGHSIFLLHNPIRVTLGLIVRILEKVIESLVKFTKKNNNKIKSAIFKKKFRPEFNTGVGLNSGVTFDRVVRSSGWEKSWKELLSDTVTCVSTTWAKGYSRVNWRVFQGQSRPEFLKTK